MVTKGFVYDSKPTARITTKIGIFFLIVVIGLGAGIGFWGIPAIQKIIKEREENYAISFLENEANANKELKFNQALSEKQETDLLTSLNRRFQRYYFHPSGRLFIMDQNGDIIVASDPTLNGRSVNNFWTYDDGKKGKLLYDIQQPSLGGSPNLVKKFKLEDVDKEEGKIVQKTLFVTNIAGTSYLMCISVNDEDLYYQANSIRMILILSLSILLLVFYLFFHTFYTRLHKRYERVVESAQQIARGNYELSIQDDRNDEIGILAQTIDHLAADLRMKQSLEKQIRQVQKMEVVGSMASGIAHDFNNVLAGILSGIELCTQEIRSPSNGKVADIELIEKTLHVTGDCAIRGKNTVDHLLTFSKKKSNEMETLDLNTVVEQIHSLCKHSFDRRVNLRFEKHSSPMFIDGDMTLLEQALLNLCLNARDAMENNGILSVRLKLIEKVPKEMSNYFTQASIYCLEVSDTGAGMTDETKRKVFEPFFTTKQDGTGLGLAMVYKIVTTHGGWIDIKSQIGQGTSFKLFFPKSSSSPKTESPISGLKMGVTETQFANKVNELPKGTEKILLIDDDEFMQQMTSGILARLGYETTVIGNGQEAIDFFKKNHKKIDLVLLDLMMPEVPGDVVFENIIKFQAETKVILISGSKRDPRIMDLLANGCKSFLNKPCTIEDLSQAIREVLDAKE
ncbi:MAG: ATP-binding protein [Lentisphaeria bacterium]|nr:ATP-binding protein [Lentisphaeria bacterium]